jgi:hypothetical protein
MHQAFIDKLMIDRIAQALANACARLDCGLSSPSPDASSDEEIRRKAALAALGSRNGQNDKKRA